MDFVLVLPLISALLSIGQSYTETPSRSCYAMCPPGYYKVGTCDDPAAKHKCEKCENATFTDIENTTPKCRRCDSCGHYEREVKPCTFKSDVQCDCEEGYYNANINHSMRNCQQCPSKICKGLNNPDHKKHLSCQRCSRNQDCQRKCIATPLPTSTNPPAATTTSTTVNTATTTSGSNSMMTTTVNPGTTVNQMPWLCLVGVVTFLLLLWLLLLLISNLLKYSDSCLLWIANKHLESPVKDPKLNEPHSHQGSSPTTLTVNISEETPMMLLSPNPATPPHPALIRPVLPDADHDAARHDEQSEHWPAIVLYAIIKEVPLRRWKEFLRLLSVADQQLERVELEAGLGLGSIERQYQMLRLWSQRSSASLNDVFSALHYMDLSGCAQLLQENLEKLQWRSELKQDFRDHGFNGAMRDT